MKQLRTLLYKEWRDQRALIFISLALCVLVFVLGKVLGGKRFSPEVRSQVLTVCLGLFAMLMATETIAREAQNGVGRTLARLPVSRTVAWVAKASFVALASTGVYVLLTLAELILRTTEPRRALPPHVILPEVLILIAAVTAACFVAVCVLRRSLPAAFLGLMLVASVPALAYFLPPLHITEWVDVVLCSWTPQGFAGVGIAACLLGSLLAFRVRRIDRFGVRRAAAGAIGLGIVLVPVFAGTARSSAWALDITPYSRTAKITFAIPSPDGRFIAIQAEQDWDPSSNWLRGPEPKPGFASRWRREVWILDRSTGALNQIDERYRFFKNGEPAWDEHGLLSTISTAGAFGGRDSAVERIDPRSGRVVSARDEDISKAVLPWWRNESAGKDFVLRWPAKNLEVRARENMLLRATSEPGVVFHDQDGFLVRHQLDSDCVTRLVALQGPSEQRFLILSEDGRLLYLTQGLEKWILDACDGRIIREFDHDSGWCGWSAIPGRVCIVWHSGDTFTALNEDGTETPLPGFESGNREVGPDHILRCEPQRLECMKLDGSEREVLYEARP